LTGSIIWYKIIARKVYFFKRGEIKMRTLSQKRTGSPSVPAMISLVIVHMFFIGAAVSALTITDTIVVSAGTTYDGGDQTIIAQGMGDGSQDEGKKPIFKLESGA
jgi:hypothetical protein